MTTPKQPALFAEVICAGYRRFVRSEITGWRLLFLDKPDAEDGETLRIEVYLRGELPQQLNYQEGHEFLVAVDDAALLTKLETAAPKTY